MNISEQVKELRETAELFDEIDDGRRMLLQAADTIETLSAKLAAVNGGGWIPCSERLPDQRDNYLCTTESSSGHRFRMIGHYNLPGWTDDNKMQQTIAWQPLPEPYHEH